MAVSEAQKRANMKFVKEKTRRVAMNLVYSTDADIIAKLESVDSMQGYIKALIRADIAAAKYYTAEADTLQKIAEFKTVKEAQEAVARYEEEDRKEGLFSPGSYTILDKDGRRLVEDPEE